MRAQWTPWASANPSAERYRLTADDGAEPSAGGQSATLEREPDSSTQADAGASSPATSDKAPQGPFKTLEEATRGWAELKGRYDSEISKTRQELARLSEELDRQREPEPMPESDDLALRAEALTRELATIPAEDKNRVQKVYHNLLLVTDEIARRRAEEALSHREYVAQRYTEAEAATVEQLKKVGLDDSFFVDAKKELSFLDAQSPGWDQGLTEEQAIGVLVGRVQDNVERIRGRGRDVDAANKKLKQAAQGVLGEGPRGVKAAPASEEDDGGDSFVDQIRHFQKVALLRDGNARYRDQASRGLK